MLHALLRHKLHASVPEPQRLEDALTSTLFAPLFWLDAKALLIDWLGLRSRQGALSGGSIIYWYWPRLAFAGPDVVFRLDRMLVVVEAKFASGRHDTAVDPEDEHAISDQIVRQYDSIVRARSERFAYTPLLEAAIAECSLVQVMVVDGRRIRRARRECNESRGRLPKNAELHLATWQTLYSRLAREPRDSVWARELLEYMEAVGLDSFNGMGRHLGTRDSVGAILNWRAPQRDYFGIREAVAGIQAANVIRLQSWRHSPRSHPEHSTQTLRSLWAPNAKAALQVLKWGRYKHQ